MQIQRDGGDYETMPPGYPQLSPRGSQDLFVLRFPRFNSSVLYDPMIVLSSTSDADSSVVKITILTLIYDYIISVLKLISVNNWYLFYLVRLSYYVSLFYYCNMYPFLSGKRLCFRFYPFVYIFVLGKKRK